LSKLEIDWLNNHYLYSTQPQLKILSFPHDVNNGVNNSTSDKPFLFSESNHFLQDIGLFGYSFKKIAEEILQQKNSHIITTWLKINI